MIDDLTDPAHRSTYSHPRGFRGPAFGIGDLYIWGFTAALLNQLLELGGWDKPWDTERLTAIPERFLAEGSR